MKVVVGLSGGIDSAFSAYLLKKQGHDVHCVFMKNWEEVDDLAHCTAKDDFHSAQQVAQFLELPLSYVNFSAEYWELVFERSLAIYQKGMTPNPDVFCNESIKFGFFYQYAKALGADKIATGHYASIEDGQLKQALDSKKDQSYFLYRAHQTALQNTIFPLSDWLKEEVRTEAKKLGFPNALRKDSTGICFIGERDFTTFLGRYLPSKTGDIVNEGGAVIGQHQGVWFYTIGQRSGIGIGGTANGNGNPWFVADKDIKRNELLVVNDSQHPRLFTQTAFCEDLSYANRLKNYQGQKIKVRVRHQSPLVDACLTECSQDQLKVSFSTPQRALTPGQALVIYSNDYCLGGGSVAQAV